MQSLPASAPDWPALRRTAERDAVRGAAALLAASFAYCWGYALLAGTGATALQSLGWALADWSAWLLLAPLAAGHTVALHAGGGTRRAIVREALLHALACAALALAVRAAVDAVGGNVSLAFLLFKRLPPYAAVAVAAMAWGCWLARPLPAVLAPQASAAALAPQEPAPAPRRGLLVQSARGEHLLPLASVSFIEACGNYLEVRSGGAAYLMRLTMKALEDELRGSSLVRCHRSYFVNLDRIARLETRPTGNHVLVLDDGASVPVSKAYRDELRGVMERGAAA